MKNLLYKHFLLFYLLLTVVACSTANGATQDIMLHLTEQDWQLDDHTSTHIYSYNQTMPGYVIRANVGETLNIKGVNQLPVTTNIHWHGLRVPVDQDGPSRVIAPGDSFEYSFKPKNSGTYWYHSHTRPVQTQVDMGLFAPLIINAPEDKLYDSDSIVVIDDLYLDSKGKRLEGAGVGHLERLGNVLAINGKIKKAIQPLEIKQGDVNKLRLLNASTAAYYRISFPLEVLVTHEDGAGLSKPFKTDQFLLGPAERVDIEMIAQEAGNFNIDVDLTDRMYQGKSYGVSTTYPIVVVAHNQKAKSHIFRGVQKEDVSDLVDKDPDYILTLKSRMNMGHMNGMARMHSGMHGHNMASMMKWTINGEEFPNVPPLNVKLGQWVKVRFVNSDMHAMDHPMHLHGTHFRVLDVSGVKLPEIGLERDVINVPSRGYTDIAFKLDEPGDWMLHCHILDHEDGGMMMVVSAS